MSNVTKLRTSKIVRVHRYIVRWTEDDGALIQVHVTARSTTEALLRASLNKSSSAEGLYVIRV